MNDSVTEVLSHKYFTPKDGRRLLRGYQMEDGTMVVSQTNGSVEKGDAFSQDQVEIIDIKQVRLNRVIDDTPITEIHPEDREDHYERINNLRTFIGCRFLARKAHYADGTLMYYLIDLGEYISEDEVELLS